MPVYEYQCSSCNHRFERRQKFSDPPLSDCPECGGDVRKLISSTAFSLKGGGWYSEGYSSSSAKPSSAAPSCSSGGGCCGCPSANAA
ncbi:MAG: hypothetical protein Fur0034_13730 [Desulfuromonadia bacterium]